jgi:hypothetical protein
VKVRPIILFISGSFSFVNFLLKEEKKRKRERARVIKLCTSLASQVFVRSILLAPGSSSIKHDSSNTQPNLPSGRRHCKSSHDVKHRSDHQCSRCCRWKKCICQLSITFRVRPGQDCIALHCIALHCNYTHYVYAIARNIDTRELMYVNISDISCDIVHPSCHEYLRCQSM